MFDDDKGSVNVGGDGVDRSTTKLAGEGDKLGGKVIGEGIDRVCMSKVDGVIASAVDGLLLIFKVTELLNFICLLIFLI